MANRKRNVGFAKPEEPEFIKKLKIRAGITRGPDVDTKKEILPAVDDEDLEDKDEEQPVIVVLKKGDLTEDEVKQIADQNKAKDEEKDIKDGKIIFKKPDKSQTSDKSNDLFQSKTNNRSKIESNIKQRIQENDCKSVKNSSLLSFNEEEEEEDSD